MSKSETMPQAEEYVAATERAFTRCPTFKGLRLLSAEARFGFLTVRFEGPMDDHRGPYGAVICLPDTQPESGTQPKSGTERGGVIADRVQDWAHRDLTIRTLEAYASSHDQERPYTRDGVWWLINDRAYVPPSLGAA